MTNITDMKNTLDLCPGGITYSKAFTNGDTQVKIVCRYMPNVFAPRGFEIQTDVYKLLAGKWAICSIKQPAEPFKGVDHYVNFQRPEALRLAPIGQILQTSHEFNILLATEEHQFTDLGGGIFAFQRINFELINPEKSNT